MNTSNRTLWLGNIESWMDITFLKQFLAENNIFPRKISIKAKGTKRGCAFLKFDSNEIAQSVIDKNNGKIHRTIEIKLNWLFVGNIDKTISNDELKKYFLDLYKSIISVKIIIDPITNRSKGYGFVEFTNYKEFNKALNNKNPVFLGKQKLVFNSGKNRYDELEDDYSNEIDINKRDSINSLTLTKQSSTEFTSSSLSSKNSFVEENLIKKPNLKKLYSDNFEDKEFQCEIKYAFNCIYDMVKNLNCKCESKQCNYYCNTFLNENNISFNMFPYNDGFIRNNFECSNYNKYESCPYS